MSFSLNIPKKKMPLAGFPANGILRRDIM